MTLDGNYSTIDANEIVYSVQPGLTSRITSTLSSETYATGITAGDVIRYDTSSFTYVKASADESYKAEVYGIVESYNSDDASLLVVLNGSIKLPAGKVENDTNPNTGNDDIYFLSETPGFIKNIPPRKLDYVVKPIYQSAPHGEFTGLVRNYLGYRSINGDAAPVTEGDLIAFSQNMEYAVEYNNTGSNLFVYTMTYSSGTFTRTLKNIIRLFVDLNINATPFSDKQNFDIKISDNGEEIMIFDKSGFGKIYHINVSGTLPSDTVATLKATINPNLPGNNVDKLWACDDELTCMTVSSRALERSPRPDYDTKLTSHAVCSKIKYYIRTINNKIGSKYNWIKANENHAFGYCDVNPYETIGSPPVDSLQVTPGIYRTYDIKCVGKNFTLTTICLKQDQINYKSKITGYLSERYSTIDILKQKKYLTSISLDASTFLTTTDVVRSNPYFGSGVEILDSQPNLDDVNKIYRCGGGFKHYRILYESSGYYEEDSSYKDSGGIYYSTFRAVPNYNNSGAPGSNLETKILVGCPTPTQAFYLGGESHPFSYPFFSEDGLEIYRYSDVSTILNRITPNYTPVNSNLTTEPNTYNLFATDSNHFVCTPNQVLIDGNIVFNLNNSDKAQFYNTANGVFFIIDEKIHKFNGSNAFEEQVYT